LLTTLLMTPVVALQVAVSDAIDREFGIIVAVPRDVPFQAGPLPACSHSEECASSHPGTCPNSALGRILSRQRLVQPRVADVE